MARDSQRQKVYDAESAVLPPKRHDIEQFPDLQSVCDWVHRIANYAWYKRRFPTSPATRSVEIGTNRDTWYASGLIVKDGSGTRIARGGRFVLNLPLWARSERTILHELAHHVTSGGDPGHGWEFCANHLTLVRFVQGKETHDLLRQSYRDHGVRYKKQRKRRPMSVEEKAEFAARMAAARAAASRPDEVRAEHANSIWMELAR